MDIVCRQSGIRPDAVVIVATVKALMMHGGADLKDPASFTSAALEKGFSNLDKHIENMASYGVPVVVSINHFASDSQEDIDLISKHCAASGVDVVLNDGFLKGGEGGKALAQKVVEVLDRPRESEFSFSYEDSLTLKQKIETVAKKIYGADGVEYSSVAEKQISDIETNGYGSLPICIAKTQYSISDKPDLKGAPKGWILNVREVNLSAGAGFIVPVCGTIMLMPGLAKEPAALRMDLTDDGRIIGLK